MKSPGLDRLEHICADLRHKAIFLQTEPHSPERIWWLDDTPRVELFDFLKTPFAHRKVEIEPALTLVSDALAATEAETVIFDTTEGWLSTSLGWLLRYQFPNVKRVGLQHGVMELSGLLGWKATRKCRALLSSYAVRCLGVAPLGGGFGNTPFDTYCVFGPVFQRYIHELYPKTAIHVRFPMVSSIGSLPKPPDRSLEKQADTWLFLDQVFTGNDSTSVLSRISELAGANGAELAYRPHPKQLDDVEIPESTALWTGGSLAEVLHGRGKLLVISYTSTGLLEAEWLGHEILSIEHESLPSRDYDLFEGTVSLADLFDLNQVNVRSRVREGLTGEMF